MTIYNFFLPLTFIYVRNEHISKKKNVLLRHDFLLFRNGKYAMGCKRACKAFERKTALYPPWVERWYALHTVTRGNSRLRKIIVNLCHELIHLSEVWITLRSAMQLHTTNEVPLTDYYTYTLVTCGDSVGLTTKIFQKILANKGLCLHGHYDLVMPESYVCLPFMYTDTPEKEHRKIAQATIDLKQIICNIQQHRVCLQPSHPGALPKTYSHAIGAFFNKYMITDKPFRVDEEKCIGCGKCAETCSVGNIAIGEGSTPEFKHTGECTCCLSCYHHCPTHAINYGRITRKRGQYYFGRTSMNQWKNTENQIKGLIEPT